MQVPEFTVVDFNACFGGRSLAFRDCGFSVVTAAESDPVKQEILRGIVPNIPIFTEMCIRDSRAGAGEQAQPGKCGEAAAEYQEKALRQY